MVVKSDCLEELEDGSAIVTASAKSVLFSYRFKRSTFMFEKVTLSLSSKHYCFVESGARLSTGVSLMEYGSLCGLQTPI